MLDKRLGADGWLKYLQHMEDQSMRNYALRTAVAGETVSKNQVCTACAEKRENCVTAEIVENISMATLPRSRK